MNLYLETVEAASRVESVRAQQDTATVLLTQAQDLKAAGLIAGIDVLRAQVQAQTQRQRVIAAENAFEKAKLQLERAVGIPVGQPLTLTDTMPYAPIPPPTLDAAMTQALAQRADFLEAKSRVDAADATHRAATSALLPTLHVDGDWGGIGQSSRRRAQHLHDRGDGARAGVRRRPYHRAAHRVGVGAPAAPGRARGTAGTD